MNGVHKLVEEIMKDHAKQVYASLVWALNQQGIAFPDLKLLATQRPTGDGGPSFEQWTEVHYNGKPILRYNQPRFVQRPADDFSNPIMKYEWKVQVLDEMEP